MNSYTELQAFVADFLARDDLGTQIPTFIKLAEQRMSRELQVALLERVARASVIKGQQFVNMPTDLRSIRELAKVDADGTRKGLEYLSPPQLNVRKNDGYTPADTISYTITANDFELFPAPAAAFTLEIIYNESVAALSDSNPTNTMLTRHGDCYLHGSLKHAFDFLGDEQRAVYHDSQFVRAMAEIEEDSNKQRYGVSDLQIRRAVENDII